jgi:hypothetical protein
MRRHNSNFYLFPVLFLAFSFLVGCSVAQPLNGTDAGASNSVDSPVLPSTPTQPVIVTEPIPIVSPDFEENPIDQPVATNPEYNSPDSESTEPPSDEPEYVDPPDTIATIDESSSNPAAEIVEADNVVSVVVPPANPVELVDSDSVDAENENPIPNVALEPDVAPEEIEDRLPASLMEVVEIANTNLLSDDEPLEELTPEISYIADNEEGESEGAIEDEYSHQNKEYENHSSKKSKKHNRKKEKETEFSVNGNCLGKKKAGVIWYDKRDKQKKKSKSVICRSNKFETKIREKRKHLKFIKLQTLFFD